MRELNARTVSVGVVCMTSARHLAQCLASLRAQRGAPDFDVTVVSDPAVAGIEACRAQFPECRFVVNSGQRTPLQLVSRTLRECRGELILLTKDHCVPSGDWVRAMVEAQAPGRAVVGGRVELSADATSTDWAFHFIDFYRYAAPVREGAASSLTVCNVSYQRSRLEAVRDVWEEVFVETAVNGALAARFGSLWLSTASEVTMHRHLSLRNAVHELYAFGRLFGSSRTTRFGAWSRLLYAALAPALPLLLFGRMGAAALRSRRQAIALARSIAPLTLMILSRSWGEWLAYLTGRPPRGRFVAR